MKKFFYWEIIILIIINLSVFSNTLNGDFVWDDHEFITDNPIVKNLSFTNLYNIFFSIKREEGAMYCPVTLLSFAIDYKIGHANPFYFHLINILFHIVNSILVYLLFLRLTDNRYIGITTALIFSIHPARTESVAWIIERKDVLSGFFFLLSYLLYIKYLRTSNKVIYIFSFFLFILSILSKVTTITFPIILIVFDYIMENNISFRKKWLRYIPFLMVSLFVFYLHTSDKDLVPSINPRYANLTFSQTLLVLFLLYGKYIIIFLYPFNLNIIYINTHDIRILPPADVIIYFLIGLTLLLTALFFRKREKFICLGILWFYIIISPHIFHLFRLSASISTRFLYLSSIGLSFIISDLLYRVLYKRKSLFLMVLVIIVLSYSSATMKQNTIWLSDITLWETAYKEVPNNTYIIKNLGVAYMKARYLDEAIEKFQIIINREPNNYNVYMLLGHTFEYKKDYKNAENIYKKAIKIRPDLSEGYVSLGAVYYELGHYSLSYEMYSMALKIKPDLREVSDFLPHLKGLVDASHRDE